MKVIHKQTIPKSILNGSKSLKIPIDAKILDIQLQYGDIVVWYEFEVMNKEQLVERRIACVGTGIVFDTEYEHKYISTIQIEYLVYHFYVEVK